jgi:hypothetical protein
VGNRGRELMSDKFNEIWLKQLQFNDIFFKKKLGKKTSELSLEEKVSWTKNHLLSIVKEAMEVLDEIPNWKEHRNEGDSEFVLSNLTEEIIDVNKFAVGLAQLWGMSSDQYYEEYIRKSIVVEQRWNQEQELNLIDKGAKIVGIDIDGVLGEYHSWFLKFVEGAFGLQYDTIEALKAKVGTKNYEYIKSEYRQSGIKAHMPAREGASELTYKLKEMGYQIVILTARPYKKYTRIYSDTLEFLKANDIQFDAIIWDEVKHLKIIKEFPNLEFMIEDTPEIAIEVAKEGYKVFMPSGPNNQKTAITEKNITVVDNLKHILYLIG